MALMALVPEEKQRLYLASSRKARPFSRICREGLSWRIYRNPWSTESLF
jgi:hypothetical protein